MIKIAVPRPCARDACAFEPLRWSDHARASELGHYGKQHRRSRHTAGDVVEDRVLKEPAPNGSIRLGSLFLTLATRLLTGQRVMLATGPGTSSALCHFPATKGRSYRTTRRFVSLPKTGSKAGMLYTVQVRLDEGSLVARMSEMREWLDAHRYEPDMFQYRMGRRGALLRVDFKIESEAFAFADAFGGSLVR